MVLGFGSICEMHFGLLLIMVVNCNKPEENKIGDRNGQSFDDYRSISETGVHFLR